MSSLNTVARELVLKIVYYGPGLGGKTTSLQALHASSPAERRGKLVSLATPVDRTLYFDFLPLRLPPMRGLSVRLQLFTVPGQVYFNATRRLVLSGADGLVFVADSQRSRIEANLESLENLRDNLLEHGRDLSRVPHVIQWNKRDLDGVLPTTELEDLFNERGAPSFETIATRGEGVQAALDRITAMVMSAHEAQLPPTPPPPEVAFSPRPPMVVTSRASEPSLAEGSSSASLTDEAMAETRRNDADALVTARAAIATRQAEEAAERVTTPEPPRVPSPAGRDASDTREYMPEERSEPAPIASRLRVHAPPPPPMHRSATPTQAMELRPIDPEQLVQSIPPPSALPRLVPQDRTGMSNRPSLDATAPFSFAMLFAPGERHLIEQIEASIAYGALADALGMCEATLQRMLGNAAQAAQVDSPRPAHDASLALAFGIDGRRFLTFRNTAARARRGSPVTARDVLEAFAFVVEARVAVSQVELPRSISPGASSPEVPAVSLGEMSTPLDSAPPLPVSTLSYRPAARTGATSSLVRGEARGEANGEVRGEANGEANGASIEHGNESEPRNDLPPRPSVAPPPRVFISAQDSDAPPSTAVPSGRRDARE